MVMAMACTLLAAGCATPRMVAVDANAYWSGRMAIQVLKEPPESLSAGFELQGSAQAGEMVLLSPIGTTLARLEWTPQGARLAQGQQQLESTSLQRLGARLTGTELPIAALFEWLAGRPAEAPAGKSICRPMPKAASAQSGANPAPVRCCASRLTAEDAFFPGTTSRLIIPP
jgi:outer membrane lipoprotein LolB